VGDYRAPLRQVDPRRLGAQQAGADRGTGADCATDERGAPLVDGETAAEAMLTVFVGSEGAGA